MAILLSTIGLFWQRSQVAGETVTDFDAALRKLATHCQFGANLAEALRNRFVCGLRHEPMQRQLLSEKELTYVKAMDIALSMVAADKNTQAFRPGEPAICSLPNHLRQSNASKPCYRCGRSTHDPAEPKLKDAECYHCHKKGHIAPVCRSKSQPQR